jgi:serine/threonine protein kinase
VAISFALSSSPYFVPLIAYTDFSKPALLTKLFPLGSLSGIVHDRNGFIVWSNAIISSLAFDIAMGLSHMHQQGIAHCDLKPANVLVEYDHTGRLRCKITDFGCAVFVDSKLLQVKAFQVSTARGLSLQYASPEVFGFMDTGQGEVYSGNRHFLGWSGLLGGSGPCASMGEFQLWRHQAKSDPWRETTPPWNTL